MTEKVDPLVEHYNRIVTRHGDGRRDIRFVAEEVFQFPGECQDVAELQARVVAQLAGLVEGLVDYGILDDAEMADGVLLSVMRAVSNR